MESSANISDQKCSLEDQLAKSGLDPVFWLQILKDELGITKGNELQYLTSKDIEKIEKYAKEEWQKNALKRIVKDDQDAKHAARKNEQLSSMRLQLQPDKTVHERFKASRDNFKVSPTLEDIGKKSQNHDLNKVISQ